MINLTVRKPKWRKCGYEFSFSLNPSDIPSDAQAWKADLLLYPVGTEDQLEAYSKKKFDRTLGTSK